MSTKIFIDPGHGGPDPGAIGNGVIEQYVNLNVANELSRLLKQGGYSVMQYRTTPTENVLPGKNDDLRNRAAMANNWGADCFISTLMLPILFTKPLFSFYNIQLLFTKEKGLVQNEKQHYLQKNSKRNHKS